MISLATHQSAIWGYDSKLSYDATSFTYTGNVNFIGSWTTPTLAPNGKLYSILSCASTTATGSTNSYVIAIITPNNANHTSTNWSAATVQYITADGSANRPYWDAPFSPLNNILNNSLIRFTQKGILAANGKIYFMPFKSDISIGAHPKWVVLTPGDATTTTWETVSFTNTSYKPGALGGCVAGKDGYLYVLPNTDDPTSTATACPFFRIHPKNVTINGVTATVDTAYIGYWTGVSGKRFYADNLNSLTWRNSAGVTSTDIATGTNNKGITIDANSGSIADMIVHVNGNIYILPRSNSRGRIFYIKPSNFGTAQEVCSETGLHINQISGGSGLFLASHSAFYESKKDDAFINNNSLNIFIIPNVQYTSPGVVATTNFLNIIKLYGATNTLTSIAYTPILSGISTDNLMTAFPVSNGTIMFSNIGTTTSKSLDQLITGEDVSGTYKLVTSTNSNGIIAGTSAQVAVDFGIGNAATNRRDISSYHVGVNLSKTLVITNFLKITELVPVKGYHPGVTYFNSYLSEPTDLGSMYKIPTNVTTTPISLYNSQKNKLK
jgi:hypothetical protein